MRQKILDGKSWYSPSPLIHKLFRYRKFSETQRRRFQLRNFSALWDKKFSTENLDTPPPPSYPLIFSLPEIFWNTAQKGSPTKFFGTVRQKKFRQKIENRDITLWSIKFFDTRNSWNTKGFPLRKFSELWDKKFSTKNLDPLPPPLKHKLFRYRKIFWNTAPNGSSTKCFGIVRQKIFDRKSWHNPLKHKFFRYQNFSETPNGSPTKFFGTVRQNNFDGKSWYPSPFLSLTFFRFQRFYETQKGSSTKFFGNLRQSFYNGKSWYLFA